MALVQYADSGLCDRIIEAWQQYKPNPDHVSGDFYWNEVTNGILFNKEIRIFTAHLPKNILAELESLNDEALEKVIFKTIMTFFATKYGASLAQEAKREKRITWRFIK